jgi:thymidylate kinase
MVYERTANGASAYPGDLICLEGADGVGKTTQAQILYETLKYKTPKVEEKYPGGVHLIAASEIDPVVTEIRKLLFGGLMSKMADNTQVALFLAYHMQLVEHIRPIVQNNGLVIMDRTAYSNQVYNTHRPNLDPRIEQFYVDMIGPAPSFLLFLDPLPTSWIDFFGRCASRAKQRGKVWHTTLGEYQNQIRRYQDRISQLIAEGLIVRTINLNSSDTVRDVHTMISKEVEFFTQLNLEY